MGVVGIGWDNIKVKMEFKFFAASKKVMEKMVQIVDEA